jgi:hypothetical protein
LRVKKPKNLAQRNVKEGSMYEEDWLVDKVNEAKLKESELDTIANLIGALVHFNKLDKAISLLKECRKYY